MQQAVSYLQGMNNPFEGVLEAYGQGQVLRENRDILRARQIEQARKEQAQLSLETVDWNNQQEIGQLIAQFPEYTKGAQDYYNNMEAKEQKAYLATSSKYMSAIDSGRVDIAVNDARDRAAAYRDMGNEEKAQEYSELAEWMAKDHVSARKAIAMGYAANAPKDATAGYKSLVDADIAQNESPANIAKTQADAFKTNVESNDKILAGIAAAAASLDPQTFSRSIAQWHSAGQITDEQFDELQGMMKGTPEDVLYNLQSLAKQSPEYVKAFKPEVNVVNTGATTDIVEYDPQTGQAVTRKQLQNTVSPNQEYSSNTNIQIAGINQDGQNQRANLAAETSRYNADQQALLKKYQIDVNDKQASQKLEYAYQQEDIKSKTAELKTINGKVWLFYPKLNKLRAVVNQNGQQLKDIKPNAVDAGKKRVEQQRIDKVNLLIPEMRKLLPQATGSYTGTATDKVLGAVGYATDGAKASAQLKALAGQLVSTMPRMEGPQSDKDVAMYQQMAGDIGDSTKTRAQRLAALDTIEKLNKKYDNLNNGRSNTANTSKFFK